MLSRAEQAALNLEAARILRAEGHSYKHIRHALSLSYAKLHHVRRALSRAKAAGTRLRSANRWATDRDLPIRQCVLPAGLRKLLVAAGYRTLGDLADRLADPDFSGLESHAGIGLHKARAAIDMLDHLGLSTGPDDLKASIERFFPELGDGPSTHST